MVSAGRLRASQAKGVSDWEITPLAAYLRPWHRLVNQRRDSKFTNVHFSTKAYNLPTVLRTQQWLPLHDLPRGPPPPRRLLPRLCAPQPMCKRPLRRLLGPGEALQPNGLCFCLRPTCGFADPPAQNRERCRQCEQPGTGALKKNSKLLSARGITGCDRAGTQPLAHTPEPRL